MPFTPLPGIYHFHLTITMKRTLLLAAAYLLRSANADCAVYTVQAGDTCVSIGRSTNATYAQLLAWNSEINIQCS